MEIQTSREVLRPTPGLRMTGIKYYVPRDPTPNNPANQGIPSHLHLQHRPQDRRASVFLPITVRCSHRNGPFLADADPRCVERSTNLRARTPFPNRSSRRSDDARVLSLADDAPRHDHDLLRAHARSAERL